MGASMDGEGGAVKSMLKRSFVNEEGEVAIWLIPVKESGLICSFKSCSFLMLEKGSTCAAASKSEGGEREKRKK